MCDCYAVKCDGEGCDFEIGIHIADFCAGRETVKAYCPDCAKKLTMDEVLKYQKVFMDEGVLDDGFWGYDLEEEDQKDLRRGKVIFLCSDPDAYGIHLN